MRRTVYNEDHEAFRDTLRSFIEAEVVPVYDEWLAAGQAPREFYYKLGELGIFGIEVPEEFGGAGEESFKYQAIISEECARAGVSFGGSGVHVALCLPYLKAYATEDQKKRWLPDFVTGTTMYAIAMTEPGTGSDLAGMKTTAKLSADGSHYVLNGAKTFITGGVHADRVIVCARTAAPTPRTAASASPSSWSTPPPRGTPSAASSTSSACAPPTPPNSPSPTSRSPSRTCSARRTRASPTSARTSPGAPGHRGRRLRPGRRRDPVRQGVRPGPHGLRQDGRLLPEHQVRAGRLPGRGRRRRGRLRPRPGGPRRR